MDSIIKKTGIDIYAPVVIATIDRFPHFLRCIESLNKCTCAEYTEVYVAIDYPNKEKQIEGNEQIINYLISHPKFSFKNLIVIKREKNLGAAANFDDLIKRAFEKYDRVIFSEDDNEFSPNFLIYMNACLTKYKEEPSVISISGYNYPIDMSGYSYSGYASSDYCAWGVGLWKEKTEKLYSLFSLRKNLGVHNLFKVWQKFPSFVLLLPYLVITGKYSADSCIKAISIIHGFVSIFPTISKVRNLGNDGSGVHKALRNSDKYTYQTIDEQTDFLLDEIPLSECSWKPLVDFFHRDLRYYFIRIFELIIQ